MSSWIKLWTEMQSDPKILALSDEEYRFWINLLQMAGTIEQRGLLGTSEEVSIVTRKTIGATRRLLVSLQKRGLVSDKSYGWIVVNFAKRQGKPSDQANAARDRKRRERERKHEKESHA